LEFGKLKFGDECMTGLGGGVIHPGRKIFFFVNYNPLPQVIIWGAWWKQLKFQCLGSATNHKY